MLVINGENIGLYAMVEQIDQAFVEDRFGDQASGILSKEVWPVHRDPAGSALLRQGFAKQVTKRSGPHRSLNHLHPSNSTVAY